MKQKNKKDNQSADETLIGKIAEDYKLKPLLAVLIAFFGIAVAGSLFTPTRLITLLSIMLGLFLYLILPGYLLLLNIVLDDLERIILSTAVGVALIPVTLFILNLLWIPMGRGVVFGIILAISAAGIALRAKALSSSASKKPESHPENAESGMEDRNTP